ncbi:MAG: hypothetical protein HPY68_08410 [Candidatus Atribacteria bacterium]|nr:hypothetical protein [Candidatus Atribacteria bacterium]
MEERAEFAWKIFRDRVGKSGCVMCWIGFPGEDLKPVACMQGEGALKGERRTGKKLKKQASSPWRRYRM